MLILHGFWRSSATWRVRIALAFKGIDYDLRVIDLFAAGGGAHKRPEYSAMNPMEQVPLLEAPDDGGLRLAQSLAMLEYLEERWPEPPLLPRAPAERAMCRQIAEMINAGIQPLQNTGVQAHVRDLGVDDTAWVRHWVARGLRAVEAVVERTAGTYCVGEAISFADLCVVPELEFARRFDLDLGPYPTLVRVAETCSRLPAFERAHARAQPDAPKP
jgi:maleylpyruvate isomerase